MIIDGKKRKAEDVVSGYGSQGSQDSQKKSSCLYTTEDYQYYTKPGATCSIIKRVS